MASTKDLDLYGILEVEHLASEKEILKAYRKKALKVHPDKNPDNPKAAELFHELTKALEVLTDAAARAAYDKTLKAKKAAELRHKELDSKRKKFKEDLDRREAAAQENKTQQAKYAHNLKEEIERLRKEGSRLVQEEKDRLLEEIKKERQKATEVIETLSSPGARLKIKWKAKKTDSENGGYNEDILKEIFSKYGEVSALYVSTAKKGSAIIEFSSGHSAIQAEQEEVGIESNPLKISWLSGRPAEDGTADRDGDSDSAKQDNAHFTPTYQTDPAPDSYDFESLVLRRMRQAEERKRLAEQMAAEDEDT